jgi:hypothetical protein
VTPIIATVLLVALFTIGSILFMNNIYPSMAAKQEMAHRDTVAAQMAMLQGDLEGSGSTWQSRALDLSAPPSLLNTRPLAASLTNGEESKWTLNSADAVIFARNGRFAAEPTEPVGGVPHRYVQEVLGLTVELTSGSLGTLGQTRLEIRADDGYTDLNITILHTGSTGASGCKERTLAAVISDGETSISRILACDVAANLEDYRIDVLSVVPEAAEGLAALAEGYTLSITASTHGQVEAYYGLAYRDSFGALHTIGGAESKTLNLAARSTCLQAQTHYNEIPIDGVESCLGPVMSTYGRTTWFLNQPTVNVDVRDANGYLEWDLTEYTTAGTSSGDGFVNLDYRQTSTTQITAQAGSAQMCITGRGMDAWAVLLRNLEEEVAHPDAYVESFGNQACLHLDDQVVETWSLRITIHHVEVKIQ